MVAMKSRAAIALKDAKPSSTFCLSFIFSYNRLFSRSRAENGNEIRIGRSQFSRMSFSFANLSNTPNRQTIDSELLAF